MSRRSTINPLSILFILGILAYGAHRGILPSPWGRDDVDEPLAPATELDPSTHTRPVGVGAKPPIAERPATSPTARPSEPALVLAGPVVRIADGDTLDVLVDGRTTVRVRLAGIDAPERGQAFGNEAKAFLGELCRDQVVHALSLGTDKYGRVLADVYRHDVWINGEMVRAGLAWHYLQYDDSSELARIEAEARSARRALWSDSKAIPPWDYRRLHKQQSVQ